jgi:predicted transposase YdaD
MQEYFAILQKKFQFPVKQFVIYLGQGEVTMRTKLSEEEIFTGFELKNLSQLDYQTVLYSDIPEEIILAILCDFKEEEIQVVLHKIITRLQALSKDDITLQKYIRQILLLSRLRNLTTLTTQTLKDMAIVYDIEKDPLYKEGVLKGELRGELRGEQKGELRKTIQGVKKALEKKRFTLEEIADVFEVKLDFILKVQKGEIQ